MDDAASMRGGERVAHLAHERHRARGVQPRLAPQQMREIFAGEVFHDVIGRAVAAAPEIEDVDDAVVANGVDGARFVEEAADGGVVARELGLEHLDGDDAPDLGMHRAIDRAHATRADEPRQLVIAKAFTGGQRVHPLRMSIREKSDRLLPLR